MARKGVCRLLLMVTVMVAGGCERKSSTIPVEGTVTKNGKPQKDIEVVFLADPDTHTAGPRATGRTDNAGHYRLQLENGEQGAVPGTHRVLVLDVNGSNVSIGHSKKMNPASAEVTKRAAEEARKSLRVPLHYGIINDTPLRATVGAEPLTFDIDLR